MQNVSEIGLSRTICIVNPPSGGEKSKDTQSRCCHSSLAQSSFFLTCQLHSPQLIMPSCSALKTLSSFAFWTIFVVLPGCHSKTWYEPQFNLYSSSCHQVTASRFALAKHHLQNRAFRFYIFSSGHFPEVWLGDLHDLLSEISVQLCFSINCFIA